MVSTKMLLGSVSPVMQLFLRFTIAYFALCICYPKKLDLVEKKEEWYCSGQYEWPEDIFQYKDLLVGCAALSWGVYSFMLRKITARNYDMLCRMESCLRNIGYRKNESLSIWSACSYISVCGSAAERTGISSGILWNYFYNSRFDPFGKKAQN